MRYINSLLTLTLTLTAALTAHQVQTCHLNLQNITYRSSAIPCRPFAVSQAQELHARVHIPVTLLSVPRHNLSFGNPIYVSSSSISSTCIQEVIYHFLVDVYTVRCRITFCCTKNTQFLTSSHCEVSHSHQLEDVI